MFTRRIIVQYIFVFLLIGFIISVIFEGGKISLKADFLWNVLYSSALCFGLAIGNTLIFAKLDENIPWIEQPIKRLFLQILLHTVYSGGVILILNVLLLIFIYPEQYTNNYFGTHLKSNLLVGLIITVFVLLIIQGERFFENWKTSLIRAERLEKEKALAQYQALRTQVNPHFLFNSLNTLSGLISQDPILADKYLGKLSEVYRYVLTNQEKEVVLLEEELTFVESYLYLLNIRYNNQIEYKLSKTEAHKEWYIIPLGLQILVENAIKHNRISDQEPLLIEISIGEQFLVVKNEKRPRKEVTPSTRKGLDNLVGRYSYLSNVSVSIQDHTNEFSVKIPLLVYEDYHR